MQQADSFDYLIVGAGITGLSAAWYLQKKNCKIAIIDPGCYGGLIKTESKDGFTLECGPNVITLKPAISELITELGLKEKITYPAIRNYKQMVFFGGRPQEVPKSPPALFSTPLITAGNKIRILKNIFFKKINLKAEDDISVREFFEVFFGSETADNIIDPVLLGIFGGDINKLSAKSIFPDLYRELSSGKTFFSYVKSRKARPAIAVIKGGFQELTAAILSSIRDKTTILNNSVKNIQRYDHKFEVLLNDGRKLFADKTFVCTSGGASAAYLQSICPGLSEKMQKLEYSSLTVVHLSLKKLPENFNQAFGVLFPSSLQSPLLGVMFNSRLFPHLSPAGKELITVCLGGAHHPDFINSNDSCVLKLVNRELSEKLGIVAPEVLQITRWKNAIPQHVLGHSLLVKEMQEMSRKFPGLYFLGADCGGIGVPDRVQAAKDIANIL